MNEAPKIVVGASFPAAIVSAEFDQKPQGPFQLGPAGEYILGRDQGCFPRLTDPSVSRRHALLVAHAGCLRIVVFPNARPLLVNGKATTERFLADGDIVRIGDTALYIHYPSLDGGEPETGSSKGVSSVGLRRRSAGPHDVRRAVMTLSKTYGEVFERLQRSELDDELGQLLGVSAGRARHLLDGLARDLKVVDAGRGTKRYVAVLEALADMDARGA
jgi:FHA domain